MIVMTNENDLYCKILYIILMKLCSQKSFLFTKFHYHIRPPLLIVIHWNEFYEENKMIKIEQAWPSSSQNIFQPK